MLPDSWGHGHNACSIIACRGGSAGARQGHEAFSLKISPGEIRFVTIPDRKISQALSPVMPVFPVFRMGEGYFPVSPPVPYGIWYFIENMQKVNIEDIYDVCRRYL